MKGLFFYHRHLNLSQPIIHIVLVPYTVNVAFPYVIDNLIPVLFRPLNGVGIGGANLFIRAAMQYGNHCDSGNGLKNNAVAVLAAVCYGFTDFNIDICIPVFAVQIDVKAISRLHAFEPGFAFPTFSPSAGIISFSAA